MQSASLQATHVRLGGYTETPAEYQQVIDRLAKKHAAAAGFMALSRIAAGTRA